MSNTYTYPSSAELQLIEQDKLPNLTEDRPIFDLMPIKEADSSVLLWEQLDNYRGLQQLRGVDGAPSRVKMVALNRYLMEPGYYGEFMQLDELELTQRRVPGTFGDVINIDDLVMARQDLLLQRRLDRIELIGWTLLATGTFSVSAPQGNVIHTDTFNLQTFASSISWATAATSTPLLDLRNVQLKARGHSVSFGSDALLFMNQTTMNNLLQNTNNADLYGRRTQGLGTYNDPKSINQLLMADNLPQLVVYDNGYYDDNGVFNLFIPNNKAILVGKRPGNVPVAEYRMTRNVNNPDGAPGAYTKVVDTGEHDVPRRLLVHDGHNGGPVIYYPSAVVVMSV